WPARPGPSPARTHPRPDPEARRAKDEERRTKTQRALACVSAPSGAETQARTDREREGERNANGDSARLRGLGEGASELDEHPHAEARGTLRVLAVLRVEERRPGDVEVGPRRAVRDELLEEQPGGEAAAVVAADVLEVGDRRVELLAVVGGQRQRPHPLAGGVGGGLHLLDERVV